MAVVASTLTTVAVFLPLVFVEGVAGQLFKDQALTICHRHPDVADRVADADPDAVLAQGARRRWASRPKRRIRPGRPANRALKPARRVVKRASSAWLFGGLVFVLGLFIAITTVFRFLRQATWAVGWAWIGKLGDASPMTGPPQRYKRVLPTSLDRPGPGAGRRRPMAFAAALALGAHAGPGPDSRSWPRTVSR